MADVASNTMTVPYLAFNLNNQCKKLEAQPNRTAQTKTKCPKTDALPMEGQCAQAHVVVVHTTSMQIRLYQRLFK